jgi:hypothetical protein
MPHEIDYRYIPEYGIEDYLPPSSSIAGHGGAMETNDNLLITLWTAVLPVEPEPPFPPDPSLVVFDDLAVPFHATPGVDPDVAEAFKPAMKSRVSSKFWFEPPFVGEEPEEVLGLIAVLKPPQDYKQQMLGAVQVVDGNIKVKRSLQGNYAWRVEEVSTLETESFGFDFGFGPLTFYSSLLPLPDEFTPGFLPYLKTNGANGETPEFFDTTTEAGFAEQLDAINRGDFYIAMFILSLVITAKKEGAATHINIEWPHTAARN